MELWGDFSHKMSTNFVSSTQSLTLIPYEFCYILAESYHSFRQVEGMGETLHNVFDFIINKQKDLVPHTRGHVLGQDYSGYASNKFQL